MDLVPTQDNLSFWLIHYGSFTIFVLLALGIIVFPIPEETLMILSGILMRNGKLPIVPTLIATLAGSMFGITISYFIGRSLGSFLLTKYGRWLGITQERLDKAHNWFVKFGKWTLLIGYFIPGIRHFTGLSAGTTKLEYNQFALFAYFGALLWGSTFLSIGYFFGNLCFSIYRHLEVNLEKIFIGVIVVSIIAALIYFFVKKSRNKV